MKWYVATAYTRFKSLSRATRDAAAATEIRFVDNDYASPRASAFARRNADRVTSLGAFVAPDFASIQTYSQLRDLDLTLEVESANVALLPCSLTKLVIELHTGRIDLETFRPLCCLQELLLFHWGDMAGFGVQLDDSFATALPLLRKFHLSPTMHGQHNVALETTAKVVMPHLVELGITYMNMVHLDLQFMSALKSLSLHGCTVSIVSAACSTMVLDGGCQVRKGTMLVTPNLRSLTVIGAGQLYKLDGSRCRHALSILCKGSRKSGLVPNPMLKITGRTYRRIKELFLMLMMGLMMIDDDDLIDRCTSRIPTLISYLT